MSNTYRQEGRSFAAFLQGLSQEDRRKGNEAEARRVQAEHARFKKAYDADMCYLCNQKLTYYDQNTPCIHWLLKPSGFQKKDIEQIAEKYGYLQIQSLLRWYANEDNFAININNLSEEGTGNKLIELTIKYKNLEWSFSCSESDFFGHQETEHSQHAHYHFQMRVDDRQFINFSDYHLPLSKMDIINIEANRSASDLISIRNSFGEGMDEMLDKDVVDQVLNSAVVNGDYEKAPYQIDSFVCAEEGKAIKGEDLLKLQQEAKEKGVTLASLLHKLLNAKTTIAVSPGPGVVKQAPRKSRRRKK